MRREPEALPNGKTVAIPPALLPTKSAAIFCACSPSLLDHLRVSDAKRLRRGAEIEGPAWVPVSRCGPRGMARSNLGRLRRHGIAETREAERRQQRPGAAGRDMGPKKTADAPPSGKAPAVENAMANTLKIARLDHATQHAAAQPRGEP